MQYFELEGREYIELNNLLKVTGLCESGGRAKVLIADGQVKVDNEIERRKRCKIRQDQVIEYAGNQLKIK